MILGRRILAATAAIAAVGAITTLSTETRAASTTANASATIVSPIAIATAGNLNFGNMSAGSAASVVRVSTAGGRSLVSGDATLITGGTIQAASFTVTGEASTGYDITLPASVVITAGANNMTINTFTDSATGSDTLDGTGNGAFTVGADLQVGIAQVAGAYTGTFSVTVNYN